jgi:hypothetical protein
VTGCYCYDRNVYALYVLSDVSGAANQVVKHTSFEKKLN